MTYDEEIIAATDAELMDGTAWLHLNPDYEGNELRESPPLERSSARSRHWSEITPGWLVQEALNRGTNDNPSVAGIGRIKAIGWRSGGWNVMAKIGHPDEARWRSYFVTDAEAEAGEGGTLLGAEVAA